MARLAGDLDERRKGWKRCERPIFVSGTLQGKFRRQTTGQWEWEPAKTVVAAWDRNATWGRVEPTPQVARASETGPKPVAIDHTVKVFLAELQETIAVGTHKKYRLLLTKFKEFSVARGSVMIDQWETSDVREFRTSLGHQPAYRRAAHGDAEAVLRILRQQRLDQVGRRGFYLALDLYRPSYFGCRSLPR